MGDFLFNDVIRSKKSGEYFLKTANSEYESRIISSFFRNGTLIDTRSRSYEADIGEENLLRATRQFHEEKRIEVQSLLELSEKQRDTDNAETKSLLGQAFLRRGMLEEAIQEFEEAIVINPDNPGVYNYLGRCYVGVERTEEAIKVLEKAIKIAPNFADLHNNLGVAYLRKETCKNAVECFDRAIEINTYYSEAYYNLALAYILNSYKREDFNLSVNVYANVMEYLEKALKINPAYRNEYFDRAEALLRNKEYEQAFVEFDKCKRYVTQPTDFSFILDFYLRIMHSKAKMKSSQIWRHIKRLEEYIKKYPNYADLYNHLGVAYVVMSKFVNNKASQQFDRALEINPNFERAKKNQRLAEYDHKGMQLLFDAILK